MALVAHAALRGRHGVLGRPGVCCSVGAAWGTGQAGCMLLCGGGHGVLGQAGHRARTHKPSLARAVNTLACVKLPGPMGLTFPGTPPKQEAPHRQLGTGPGGGRGAQSDGQVATGVTEKPLEPAQVGRHSGNQRTAEAECGLAE